LSELSESVPLGDNVIVNFTLWPGHALAPNACPPVRAVKVFGSVAVVPVVL
jgi:hypothetical protein